MGPPAARPAKERAAAATPPPRPRRESYSVLVLVSLFSVSVFVPSASFLDFLVFLVVVLAGGRRFLGGLRQGPGGREQQRKAKEGHSDQVSWRAPLGRVVCVPDHGSAVPEIRKTPGSSSPRSVTSEGGRRRTAGCRWPCCSTSKSIDHFLQTSSPMGWKPLPMSTSNLWGIACRLRLHRLAELDLLTIMWPSDVNVTVSPEAVPVPRARSTHRVDAASPAAACRPAEVDAPFIPGKSFVFLVT